MQQGMLFHTLYAPELGAYFEQLVRTLSGDLNVSAFEQAWQQVVDRHPILRTAFTWEDSSEPYQIVLQQLNVPLKQYDWRKLSSVEQQQQLEAYLDADREQGFDLSQAPPMRLTLTRIAENIYHFIWSFHHILLDRWSVSLLLNEVFTFYKAIHQNQNIPWGSSRPYRDYIAWLQQQDLSQAELFWRQKLKGFTAPTPLPVDQAVGSLPGQEIIYDEQQVRLSVAVTTALQFLAQEHRLTLNTIVQGAWALLLNRYSGEEDVIFGATVSGRPAALPGVESIAGLFINTLPVRVQVSPDDTLLPWLKRLQDQMVELRQYEYSPLVEIQGWSEVPRDLPLFNSILVFENIAANVSLDELSETLSIRTIHSGVSRTNYPLAVLALPDSELLLQITYDRKRFDPPAITRMLGHFQSLLEEFVANPDKRLTTLSLLTEAERHQLLVEWNNTGTDYPKDQCVHQLFEAQAKRTPDAVAVVYEDEQLTYHELNHRANQLARYLQTQGVGPEILVGLCVERSLEMIIGLLGILKAGGAYVPLDPAYPTERLAFMLKDTQASLLLTQHRLVKDPLETDTAVTCLDTDWKTIDKEPTRNLDTKMGPDNLAYVIHTSGSTGQPKGVQIHHRGLTNFLSSMHHRPGLTGQDTLLAITTLSFDIAALELYLPLIVGARVVVVSREVASDGNMLLETLTNSGATVIQATPATWRLLIEAGWKGSPQLKILCGGEPLPQELANQLLERGNTLWNLYGPTETTIWSTIKQIQPEQEKISIGRPIANTQIYILDAYLQSVPIGVPGELHIGGDGLARGYFNQLELTEEKFIPNPFSSNPKSRLYRTGDLARYLAQGNIEHLGRIDYQVKIRGFRIELGEVETVLDQHPMVQASVVVSRKDRTGDKRLVTYIVSKQGEAPTVSNLRDFLKKKLPDYMLPSNFVMLDSLPLTPNGKVDRKALPSPDQTRPELKETFIAPRTPCEEIVTGIWTDILGLEQIGIHDNFFELGGHSLLATQVMSRIRDAFQIELPLRIFFEAPTVAELSKIVLANAKEPGQIEKNARILKKIEAMSTEELQQTLQYKRKARSNEG